MTLLILLIRLQFKNGNFDDLRDSLSRVPFEIAASADINKFWDNWKALFLSTVKDHIPIKTVHDTNSLPWIDSEVHHWIRKKYTALKKFRLNKTPERKRKLRILSQTVKVLVRTKHQRYLTKIEASFKDNPKNFWSYHKAFLGGQSGGNLTISYNHKVAETPVGKTELFNKSQEKNDIRFPFLDILGYLKNTHKNPKFGKVRQVPTRDFPTKFPDWNLSHSSKFGIFVCIL